MSNIFCVATLRTCQRLVFILAVFFSVCSNSYATKIYVVRCQGRNSYFDTYDIDSDGIPMLAKSHILKNFQKQRDGYNRQLANFFYYTDVNQCVLSPDHRRLAISYSFHSGKAFDRREIQIYDIQKGKITDIVVDRNDWLAFPRCVWSSNSGIEFNRYHRDLANKLFMDVCEYSIDTHKSSILRTKKITNSSSPDPNNYRLLVLRAIDDFNRIGFYDYRGYKFNTETFGEYTDNSLGAVSSDGKYAAGMISERPSTYAIACMSMAAARMRCTMG